MKSIIAFIIGLIVLANSNFTEQGQDNPPTCMDCHGDLFVDEVVHRVAEMGCELCHESTGVEHPGDVSGFKLTATCPDLCHTCHDSKNNGLNVHSPNEEGDCLGCHSPHSSSYRSLILNDFSENPCLDCHYIEMDDVNSIHGPVMSGDCQACHDPHQSDHPFMMKQESKQLCLSCHDKEIETENKSIRSIAEALTEGNIIHDPITNGECVICHLPHSAEYPFLLIAEYPVQQYAKATIENFDLCFLCHDSDMLTVENTENATNFRNGTTNLHYLHIQGSRGRNCNLCHNAHGAPNDHILEETVLFGKWKMPMGLELTDVGGSCATGCHRRLEYSRVIE